MEQPANGQQKDKFTVLVVDDDDLMRDMLHDTLDPKDGLLLGTDARRVLTAENGADALAIAKRENVDMMIIDIGLPGMSGIELFYRLRAEQHPASDCCVLMTGRPDYTYAHQFMRDGGVAYYDKPFNPLELQALVSMMEDLHARKATTGAFTPNTVLVLEDDYSHRVVMSEQLSRVGFTVARASRTDEASAMLLDRRIALAVVDKNLRESAAGGEGIEWVRRARRLAPFIDYVLCTADSLRQDMESLNIREDFAVYLDKTAIIRQTNDQSRFQRVLLALYEGNKTRRAAAIRSGPGTLCHLIGPRAVGKTTVINYASMLPFVFDVRKRTDRGPRSGEIQLPRLADKLFVPPGHFDNPETRKDYLFIYTHPDGYHVGVPREPIMRAIADHKIALLNFGTRESYELMMASEVRSIPRQETVVMLARPEELVMRDKARGGEIMDGPLVQKPYTLDAAVEDVRYFAGVARRYSSTIIHSNDPDPRLPAEEQRFMRDDVAVQLVSHLCRMANVSPAVIGQSWMPPTPPDAPPSTPAPSSLPEVP